MGDKLTALSGCYTHSRRWSAVGVPQTHQNPTNTEDTMNEVYTNCPNCGKEIPFFRTVDEEGQCPNCEKDKDELFDMAIGSEPIQPVEEPEPELALTDGGRDE